jgi:hypothetical protein
MNFIKKIADKNFDELVHLQFQKFSKGEFRDKAVIEAKKSKDKYTIKTSSEFANELVRDIAEKIGSEKVRVTGAIVSTMDLKNELEFKEFKQFQGVKRYLIDTEMSGDDIIGLLNKFPKNFFALSFSTQDGNNVLKIKPKAPKSGKPGKGDEAPKADFCNLKTNDSEIGRSFVFEVPDFKEAKINHYFYIDKIEIPEELKKSEDFALIREKSRRVGRILRKSEIDGVKKEVELEFSA